MVSYLEELRSAVEKLETLEAHQLYPDHTFTFSFRYAGNGTWKVWDGEWWRNSDPGANGIRVQCDTIGSALECKWLKGFLLGLERMFEVCKAVAVENAPESLESKEPFKSAIGKRIAMALMIDDSLRLMFDDGTGIVIEDLGQQCCEDRYMRTDDDLDSFTGATLLGGEIRSVYDDPDVQFLAIKTDKGEIVCSTHNEHNGYYSGFAIVVKEVKPPQVTIE